MTNKPYLNFWFGEGDLRGWSAYVAISPLVPGQVILSYDLSHDTRYARLFFDDALNTVTDIVSNWANQYKSAGCHPIFLRMNIDRQHFRVHILPLPEEEIISSYEMLLTSLIRVLLK